MTKTNPPCMAINTHPIYLFTAANKTIVPTETNNHDIIPKNDSWLLATYSTQGCQLYPICVFQTRS